MSKTKWEHKGSSDFDPIMTMEPSERAKERKRRKSKDVTDILKIKRMATDKPKRKHIEAEEAEDEF